MAALTQTTAYITTEAEARGLCAATGTDLGGVGSYQNKGACKKSFHPCPCISRCYLLFATIILFIIKYI